MATTLYWMQAGGCGGDSMSMLNMDSPNLMRLFARMGIEVLWHPSLSNASAGDHQRLLDDLIAGRKVLDIFCLEGFPICGPDGSGRFDTLHNRPKKDLIITLARRARYVVAAGTCAAYSGIGAPGQVEATGLQFHKDVKGGLLGKQFLSAAGLPVINLSGCPVHPAVLSDTLLALAGNEQLELNDLNEPADWFGTFVHQGCVRNEYHEYRVEENHFGERGCLFFHLGCRGPLTRGPCNKMRWNRRNSKPNAGAPCVGCTHPRFPLDYPFFRTRSIADVPMELPDGVDRAHYLAYKGIAAAAGPERLKERKTPL